jgi:hypothetical protein
MLQDLRKILTNHLLSKSRKISNDLAQIYKTVGLIQ